GGDAAAAEDERAERGEGEKEDVGQTKRMGLGGAGETHGVNLPRSGRETRRDAAGARRLWWCNADFDLALAHGGGKVPAAILAAARGMAWHMWPALAPGDALLVDAPPPRGFLEGLRAQGLAPPRFVVEGNPPPADLAGARFTPFGWNDEAHARLESLARAGGRLAPAGGPSPDVVRRANGRALGS